MDQNKTPEDGAEKDSRGRSRRRLQRTSKDGEQKKTTEDRAQEDSRGRSRGRLQRTRKDGAEEDSRGRSRGRLQRMDRKKTPEDRADSSYKSLPGWLVQCCEWFSILCLNPFPDISKLH